MRFHSYKTKQWSIKWSEWEGESVINVTVAKIHIAKIKHAPSGRTSYNQNTVENWSIWNKVHVHSSWSWCQTSDQSTTSIALLDCSLMVIENYSHTFYSLTVSDNPFFCCWAGVGAACTTVGMAGAAAGMIIWFKGVARNIGLAESTALAFETNVDVGTCSVAILLPTGSCCDGWSCNGWDIWWVAGVSDTVASKK